MTIAITPASQNLSRRLRERLPDKIALVCVFLALAATTQADPTVRVNFKDLDLSDPAAAAILADRIQAAAEKACGPVHFSADNRPSARSEAEADHRVCIRYATQQAMVQIQAVRPALARAGTSRTQMAGQ